MRDYGKIRACIWSDEKFQSLSVDGKLIFIYLQTNEHANLTGCYRLPAGYITTDLDCTEDKARASLAEVIRKGLVKRCERTGWTLIVNFLKHNQFESPNVAKSALGFTDAVPTSLPFYACFINGLHEYGKWIPEGYCQSKLSLAEALPKAIGSLTNTFANPEPEPEPEPEPKPKPEPDLYIVENEKTKKASARADDHLEDFATFWQAYPRKDGKAEALRKWLIEIKAGMDKAKLAACARLYGERCKKENREAKYILMPQTWLHQNRYEDEFADYEHELALANEPDYTHEEWLLVAGLRQWKTDGTWPNFLGVRPDNLLCPAPKKLFDYVGLPYPVAQETPP